MAPRAGSRTRETATEDGQPRTHAIQGKASYLCSEPVVHLHAEAVPEEPASRYARLLSELTSLAQEVGPPRLAGLRNSAVEADDSLTAEGGRVGAKATPHVCVAVGNLVEALIRGLAAEEVARFLRLVGATTFHSRSTLAS